MTTQPDPGDSRLQNSAETVIGVGSSSGDVNKTVVEGTQTAAVPGSGPPAARKANPDRPPEIEDVQLERALGQGGMGAVYRGRQITLDRPVAIKVIHPDLAKDDSFLGRFDREARVLAKLSHPNIVACYQAGQAKTGERYLLMEFVEGEDLLKKVQKNGPLSERDALVIARQVAEGLDHALDAGIIHRDVKPENILLKNVPAKTAATSIGAQAKLVDLGLAGMARANKEDVKITQAGTALGTPLTMAPEQAEAPDTIDHRADIYALGCTLYFALTGKFPHEGNTIAQVLAKKLRDETPHPTRWRADLSQDVTALTLRMMAFDAGQRPASYDDLIALLDAAIAKLPAPRNTTTRMMAAKVLDEPPAPPPAANEAAAPPSGGGRTFVALGVLVVLGGAVGGLAVLGKGNPVSTNPPVVAPAPPAAPPPIAPPKPTTPPVVAPPPFVADASEPPPVYWESGEHLFEPGTETAVVFKKWTLNPSDRWKLPEEFGECDAFADKGAEIDADLKSLPKADWLLTTRVLLRRGAKNSFVKEAGVRVRAGERVLKVTLQRFGGTTLYRIAGAKDSPSGSVPTPENEDLPNQVEVQLVKGRLWARIDKGTWISTAVEAPLSGLGVYVVDGAASFGEMMLSIPRS